MKSFLSTLAVANAIKVAPDVFGPTGENYKHDDTAIDMSKIKIDISSAGDGPVCRDTDFATIQYSAYLKNGRLVSDTKEESGEYKFAVGTGNTWKCLDLAIVQLKAGAKAHIECPSELVYGGAHTIAPLGGETVPYNSDMDFDVEVISCTQNPGLSAAIINWGDFETVSGLKLGYCYSLKKDSLFLKHVGAEVSLAAADDDKASSLFFAEKGLDGS
jgi:hypothetical protein